MSRLSSTWTSALKRTSLWGPKRKILLPAVRFARSGKKAPAGKVTAANTGTSAQPAPPKKPRQQAATKPAKLMVPLGAATKPVGAAIAPTPKASPAHELATALAAMCVEARAI